MARNSNFFPESVSKALKKITKRIAGAVLLGLGLWALFSLFFYDPYLNGFAAASTFGEQSFMGQIVGFIRYGVGFIPAMFFILCIARWGISWLAGWEEETAPEYNFIRCFVTICIGSIGLGLIMPASAFGGMIGYIVAADISSLIGAWGILVGLVAIAAFAVMGALLLHIKWTHIKSVASVIWRAFRWLLSVFHLMPATEEESVEEEEEYEEEVEQEDDEEEQETRKTKPAKRSNRKAGRSTQTKVISGEHEYELPDPAFLERSNFGKNIVTPELKRNAAAMEVHFAEYGVHGKVVGIRPGPIVTLYEFMPDSGVRMADVSKTVKDMTRAMATENIRIAHIPSTQLIGVEMVNITRQTVRFQSLVDNDTFINSKYKIPLALGVDIGGNPMYFDLAKMPHMLIAGRTGSGKSVFVQSIIMSIVYHFTPDKCKLIIIDPKGVDFGFWDDIPHLITPIVKLDAAAAVNALKWAVREMEERYNCRF